ncbi:hypothetical protein JTE90_022629 [Oedothorax gibbosus]|uniref:Uncharacterized protein n=1 Tax=Oedothorax gibbosus TaxID=931172 RepID=A0AAV6TUC8_9ARAC|nr:hypothetical protein JTE90_022629 [Oedothorax gibbosus]
MHFLEKIRNLLCHDAQHMQLVQLNDTVFAVQCQLCQNMPIPDVYGFIATLACGDQQDEACDLAQLYSEWTGDDSIPVPWVIEGIDGILMKRVMGQSLHIIRHCVALFKSLNAPFTQNGTLERNNDIFAYLFGNFEDIVESSLKQRPQKTDTLDVVLQGILKNIKDLTSTKKGKIDANFYYDSLVPFVKSCREDAPLLPPDTDQEAPLTRQLVNQLKRSQAIRQLYGPFCINFNVIHIALGFMACSKDYDVMTNWILDFAARVCRGEFFWKQFSTSPHIQKALHVFKTDVTYKRNTDVYYVMRHIKNGDGIEILSENLDKYDQLGNLLRERLDAPQNVIDNVWSSAFPAVLFDSHIPYLAFTFSFGFLLGNNDRKTGMYQKGSFVKARRMYREAEDFIRKLYEFDQKTPVIWTMDTFQLFLTSDPHMEERLKNFLAIFVKTEE